MGRRSTGLYSGQGAQGGGGGTNIDGGHTGEPTRRIITHPYDPGGGEKHGGLIGYRWKDGGLATMFQKEDR